MSKAKIIVKPEHVADLEEIADEIEECMGGSEGIAYLEDNAIIIELYDYAEGDAEGQDEAMHRANNLIVFANVESKIHLVEEA